MYYAVTKLFFSQYMWNDQRFSKEFCLNNTTDYLLAFRYRKDKAVKGKRWVPPFICHAQWASNPHNTMPLGYGKTLPFVGLDFG